MQASLAAVIITAVVSSVEYEVIKPIWRSKSEIFEYFYFQLYDDNRYITVDLCDREYIPAANLTCGNEIFLLILSGFLCDDDNDQPPQS